MNSQQDVLMNAVALGCAPARSPRRTVLGACLLLTLPLAAQQNPGNFDEVARSVQQQLETSLAELTQQREQQAAEMVPLQRRLSELEAELTKVRTEYQQAARALDTRTLDLSNLRNEIKTRSDESNYINNLLSEYLRNFESRLHIVEQKRYDAPLGKAKMALENRALSPEQVFAAEVELLTASLGRLEDALSGSKFDGTAVDNGSTVQTGSFVLVGPIAVFRSHDGSAVGTAEQRLGSLEPTIISLPTPELQAAAAELVSTGQGALPVDPTLGNAHKIVATQETLLEHFLKGGPVMYPMGVLAGLALLVALLKWLALSFVRSPRAKHVQELLAAVSRRDRAGAEAAVAKMRGPAGAMLQAGVEHIDEPRELVEEVMYETVLETKLRLNSWLPFVAITASSAPLLGLLGTVTGIMNTFTLMTAFGSGDPKVLSSGISEALITTETGLYIAIPSLMLYALLSRKSRRIQDRMEQLAVSFANQLGKTPMVATPPPAEQVA
jgi:biopolymer transport protein ExbB